MLTVCSFFFMLLGVKVKVKVSNGGLFSTLMEFFIEKVWREFLKLHSQSRSMLSIASSEMFIKYSHSAYVKVGDLGHII